MTVHSLHTVGGPQPLEAVPLQDTGETTPLAGADDVDPADLVEDLDRQGLTRGDVRGPVLTELADVSLGFGVHFLGVATRRLGRVLSFLSA